MSLRNRVAIAGGAVVLGALVLASLVLYPALGARLTQERDATLMTAATQSPDLLDALKKKAAAAGAATLPSQPVRVGETLVQVIPPPVVAGPADGFIPVSERDVRVADGREPAYFADADAGRVGADSGDAGKSGNGTGKGKGTGGNGDAGAGRTRYRVYTTVSPELDGALIRTALPTSVDAATLRRLRALLVALTLGGALLAAGAARLAAGRVLRPVRRLTETVEHVAATQDLTAAVEMRGRDEIARLAASFATMMAALDESVRTQRRLVADASHELRTPLTSLTTNLELLHEGRGLADPQAPGLVGDAREQAHQLTVLVGDLIDLARYGRAETHTEDVRLDLLAERVAARAAARAPEKVFDTELSPCLVHADPDAVERAIGNLVDNAIKWSPDGGRILVRVEVSGAPESGPPKPGAPESGSPESDSPKSGASGCVSVSDQGPGILAADLPYVFDRFYRSPAARSHPGSGLGLAIVRQIAETHGGSVAAEPLERGVRLRMSLPAIE